MAEHFEFTAIHIAAESQPLPIGFASGDYLNAFDILHQRAIRTMNLVPRIAHIEIKLPVRAEDKRVNAVIMIDTFDSGEKDLRWAISFVIVIGIRKYKHIR